MAEKLIGNPGRKFQVKIERPPELKIKNKILSSFICSDVYSDWTMISQRTSTNISNLTSAHLDTIVSLVFLSEIGSPLEFKFSLVGIPLKKYSRESEREREKKPASFQECVHTCSSREYSQSSPVILEKIKYLGVFDSLPTFAGITIACNDENCQNSRDKKILSFRQVNNTEPYK